MKTDKLILEIASKNPTTITVEHREQFIAYLVNVLTSSLSVYCDDINQETNLRYLEEAVCAASNIVSVGEDLIKQLKNQK